MYVAFKGKWMGLKRCRVLIVGDQAGAPDVNHCRISMAFLEQPKLAVLSYAVLHQIMCDVNDAVTFDATIPLDDVLGEVERRLRSEHGFSTKFVAKQFLRGTSKGQSKLISNVRQQSTLSIFATQIDNTRLGLDVNFSLVVNEQNTSSPADWHSATAGQEEQYLAGVREVIGRAARSVCSPPYQFAMIDSRTFSCRRTGR